MIYVELNQVQELIESYFEEIGTPSYAKPLIHRIKGLNELANKTEDKIGHWIEHEDDWWGNYWECSNCHDEYSIIEGDMYYKHCPSCGAEMAGI